jgi:hypothetical protein
MTSWVKDLRGVLIVGVLAMTPLTAAELSAVLATARAYLGSEAALNGLRSVHFTGTLETMETTPEGPRPVKAGLEIYFQKPYQQRIELTMGNRVEVTALDEYEGWQRVQDADEPQAGRLVLLRKEQIRRLRANTWENLSFYRGLDQAGGEVQDLGSVELEGRRVRKVAFTHGPAIVFFRYFDEASGRLLLTETEKQGSIREEGEILAGGIRFPAKIITTNKLPDGGIREVVVSFERIEVNLDLPDALFAVPPVQSR